VSETSCLKLKKSIKKWEPSSKVSSYRNRLSKRHYEVERRINNVHNLVGMIRTMFHFAMLLAVLKLMGGAAVFMNGKC
jgi:hypothetical protein